MIVSLEKPGTPQELAHFGVKGMRWGIRNEDKREGRATKRELGAAQTQKTIDELKANSSRRSSTIRYLTTGKTDKQRIQQLERIRDQQLKDAKDIREGRLTDKQRRVLKGTAAAGVVLAAYGTYKLVDSGHAHQLIVNGRAFVRGEPHSWKLNESLSGKMSIAELQSKVVNGINPNYGELGTKMNCRRCTMAYEMRRRGLDVRSTRSVSATGQTASGLLNAIDPASNRHTGVLATMINYMREGSGGPLHQTMIAEPILNKSDSKKLSYSKARLIFNALEEHPDRARGELSVMWLMGGGHSLAWEIVDGKAVVFDTQSGKTYANAIQFAEAMGKHIGEANAMRLDNLPLNYKFLNRWIQNV